MQSIKNISIPEPCHEKWQQMAPVANGSHCQSCCKTVVDFSVMPNADIIAYLASHKNTCGRIGVQKLAGLNYDLDASNIKRYTWKGLLAAASLSMLFPAVNAQAQSQPKTEQASAKSTILGKMVAPNIVADTIIKGRVIGTDDKLPVIGATISIKGTNIGAQTDVNGNFSLRAPRSAKRLVISYLGYKIVETDIDPLTSQPLQIAIEPANTLMGEISIVSRPPFYKRCWYKLKRIFKS